jgi:hypothetical protein
MCRGNGTELRSACAGRGNLLRLSCVALGLLGLVAGCTNQQVQQGLVGGGTTQVAGAVPVDGFLPKPELLVAGGPGKPDLVYLNPV